ncbi:MAG: hypothetical protein ACI4JW_01895 [Oscillospiraceae bacterium]
MNILESLAQVFGQEVVISTAEKLGKSRKINRILADMRESRAWKFIFAVFALICLAVNRYTSSAVKRYDLLGGRKTIKSFYNVNLFGFIVIWLCAIVFAAVAIKTFKGRKSPMMQVYFTVASALLIVFCLVFRSLALTNIRDDLKNESTANLKSYVLCTDASGENYYLGFEAKGEYPFLLIPKETYDELSQGERSSNPSNNSVYELVTGSEYVVYENAAVYNMDIEVRYFFNSAVFDSCSVKAEK